MFASHTAPYHLDALQWLPADVVMQEEASKPLRSRPLPSKVVSHIRKHCFVGAVKTPTHNAIKRRYQTYFSGPPGLQRSVVEEADRKMEFAAAMLDTIFTMPSQVAEEIKTTHFNTSPSELHTSEAIEKRYRTLFLKWAEADKSMKYAARTRYGDNKTFRIGAVVEHVKMTFFPDDPSTTVDHIQDRYCKLWLRIKNTPEVVRKYDQELINKAVPTMPLFHEEPATSQSTNHLNTSTRDPAANTHGSKSPLFESPSWHPETAQHSAMPLRQRQPIIGGASQEIQTTTPPTMPPWLSSDHCQLATSRPHSQKRARPNSFDSNSSASTIHHGSSSPYFNSPRPPLEKLQQRLRDSGFVSSSNASDTSSLLSRMSRLSIEFKLCTADHALLDPGSSCNFCRYPETQPKPLVYLAPEYVASPQADRVDADDIDNGITTANADART